MGAPSLGRFEVFRAQQVGATHTDLSYPPQRHRIDVVHPTETGAAPPGPDWVPPGGRPGAARRPDRQQTAVATCSPPPTTAAGTDGSPRPCSLTAPLCSNKVYPPSRTARPPSYGCHWPGWWGGMLRAGGWCPHRPTPPSPATRCPVCRRNRRFEPQLGVCCTGEDQIGTVRRPPPAPRPPTRCHRHSCQWSWVGAVVHSVDAAHPPPTPTTWARLLAAAPGGPSVASPESLRAPPHRSASHNYRRSGRVCRGGWWCASGRGRRGRPPHPAHWRPGSTTTCRLRSTSARRSTA